MTGPKKNTTHRKVGAKIYIPGTSVVVGYVEEKKPLKEIGWQCIACDCEWTTEEVDIRVTGNELMAFCPNCGGDREMNPIWSGSRCINHTNNRST